MNIATIHIEGSVFLVDKVAEKFAIYNEEGDLLSLNSDSLRDALAKTVEFSDYCDNGSIRQESTV